MKVSASLRKPGQARQRSAFKLSPVAAGCAVFLFGMADLANAQEANLETVTVSGIRAGIEAAISVKKNNSSIVEAISAEDIGKLPDTTIAESLARLPGLTTQRTKSGEASSISIRGLGPDFNGYLLNGREQTSTGDSRAVDLSVYPAELIGGATVYKTTDASVMGAGLAGTIDNRLVDPLMFGKRVLTASAEKVKTGVGLPVTGTGTRKSIAYIDQFFDRKVGLALGLVKVDGSSSQYERGNWGGATVDATLANGTKMSGVSVPDFGGGLSQNTRTITDDRTGAAAILAFKPNKDFDTQLDLFYSKIDLYTKVDSVKAGLGGPITNATVSGGVATKGTFSLGAYPNGFVDYSEGLFDNDLIKSVGWKSNLKLSDGWTASVDVNHNSAERVERDMEYYGQILGADTLSFDTTSGTPKFTLGKAAAYIDPNQIAIRDRTGWSGVNGVPQAGYAKGPIVKDKVNGFRFDLKKALPEGMAFSDVQFGVNYSERSKDRITDEGLIVASGSNNSSPIPYPSGAGIAKNVGDTGLDMLTFDPQAALINGAGLLRKYNDDILSKSWGVKEKVTTAYAKLDIDTQYANIPLRGNVGVQLVNTDQSSSGYRAGIGSDVVLTNPSAGLVTDGTKYTDVLPSLNLTGDLGGGNLVRFGLSEQIARPTLTDMRNSFAAAVDMNGANSTYGHFVGSAGNPHLKPFKGTAVDLSFEKYFGKKGYISAAVFYKKLDTYITSATDTKYDFSNYAKQLGLVVPPAGPLGTYTTSVNGNGGNVSGVELAASLPFNLVIQQLDGFGANASYSNTSSTVVMPDLTGLNPNQAVPAGLSMPLPGLSKTNAKLTLYFEKAGFSVFIADNYRSQYVGSVANDTVGGYPSLRYIAGSSWVSAQVGYELQDGPAKGLAFRLEGNNLNMPVYRQLRADGSESFSSKTGKSIMAKLTYKFQ